MSLEGTRGGAAGDGVQHRCFHLEETARVQEGAQIAHYRLLSSFMIKSTYRRR